MDQDESNCALWKSDNLLFFKWPVLRQHDDLFVKMNEIINGKYIRAWKNLKGLSSDKWDSAVSWNKVNLTLPCENLTFYSSRLISNRSSVRKIELVPRKLWQTNCKPFKIVQEKWDYILNLHTYISWYIPVHSCTDPKFNQSRQAVQYIYRLYEAKRECTPKRMVTLSCNLCGFKCATAIKNIFYKSEPDFIKKI